MIGFRASRAIVIGIDGYRHGIPRLSTAVNDARRIAEVLETNFGYAVDLLVEDVTLDRLRTLFSVTLLREIEDDDRLLIYFAGHGIALSGRDGPAGYLIPQDARGDDLDSFLPMTELNGWLEELSCRHLLLVMDCCFAGAIRWSSTRVLGAPPEVIHEERFNRYIRDPAWQVLTSAAHDQKALDVLSGETIGVRGGDSEQTEHSPFAAAFLRGLKGEADVVRRVGTGPPVGDGVITATELYFFLRDCVEVGAEGVNHHQTPGLWPLKWHDKGEFIHLVPGHKLNLPRAPDLDEANNPYRGLQSFDEDHARLFFGRTRFVDALARRVRDQTLTIVLGASGTGKSSVVKAGLLPFLRSQEPDAWQIMPPLRPGKSPLAALAALTLPGEACEPDAGARRLEDSRSDPEALAGRVARWSATTAESSPPARLLIVVDQFEELLTLCWDTAEREQFLVLLDRALAACPDRLRVVLTLRSDFEPQFAHSPLQEVWLAARVVVQAMTLDEYREAIEGPASVMVLYFQGKASSQAFIDRLIGDVANTPGALPLLSFTLSELYRSYLERGEDDRGLSEEDYERLGGVGGSLRNRADEVHRDLPDDAHRETMRRVMVRMVSVEGGELARRRVPDEELVYQDAEENRRVTEVLRRLNEARLVVDGQEVDNRPYIEPAHDELVRGWDKLLQWSREGAEALQLRRRLTPAATEWTAGRGGLWIIEPRLGVLKQTLNQSESWLNASEARFVRRSLTARRNIAFGTVIVVALAFALVSIAGLVAYQQRNAAQVALEQNRNSLADSYLGGIGHSYGPITDVEMNSLRALAREGDDRVCYLIFERALGRPDATRQLLNRAELVTHCAVRNQDVREQVSRLLFETFDKGPNSVSLEGCEIRLACARIGMSLDLTRMPRGDRFGDYALIAFLDALADERVRPRLWGCNIDAFLALAPRQSTAVAAEVAQKALEIIPAIHEEREIVILSDVMARTVPKLDKEMVRKVARAFAWKEPSSTDTEGNSRSIRTGRLVPMAWMARVIVSKLDEETARKAADAVAQESLALRSGPSSYENDIKILIALVWVSPKLGKDMAEKVSRVALGEIRGGDPDRHIARLARTLAALAPQLGENEARDMAHAFAAEVLKAAPRAFLDSQVKDLSTVVASLATWMGDEKAREAAKEVANKALELIPKADIRELRDLSAALAALRPHLGEDAIRGAADAVAKRALEMIPEPGNNTRLVLLSEAVTELSSPRSDDDTRKTAAAFAKRIIHEIPPEKHKTFTKDGVPLGETTELRATEQARALVPMASRMEEKVAREAAEAVAARTLEEMPRINGDLTLRLLSRAMASLTPWLREETASAIADAVTQKALDLTLKADGVTSPADLFDAVAALAVKRHVRRLARTLNNPLCVGPIQEASLAALGEKLRPQPASPFNTKWDLMAWIEANRVGSVDADELHVIFHGRIRIDSWSISARARRILSVGFVAFWILLWPWFVHWPRLADLLRQGAGVSVALIGIMGAFAWGSVAGPVIVITGYTLPSVVEKLILIALLFGLAVLWGWVQTRTGWLPLIFGRRFRSAAGRTTWRSRSSA